MAIIFSDISMSSSAIGNDDLIYDLDCIRTSIFTILSTYQGARLFRPDFGASLDHLLYDPMDTMTAFHLRNLIFTSLGEWEPRIVVDTVNSSVAPNYDIQKYDVVLIYSVPALDCKDYLNFTLAKGD